MSIYRVTRDSMSGVVNIREDSGSEDIIAVSAEDVLLFEKRIKKMVAELVKQGHKVNVVIDGNAAYKPINGMERIEYTFKPLELSKLIDLNYDLFKCGMSELIKLNEFYLTEEYADLETSWDLDYVVKANAEIDRVVDTIKELKLSPYETMVYIHKYLTQNYDYGLNYPDYRFEGDLENNRSSIVAAIKNKKTVCVGFASMTKAIIDRLNLSQLKCKYQTVAGWNYRFVSIWDAIEHGLPIRQRWQPSDLRFSHALSLITIQDPKYNIDGMYLDDATYDCRTREFPYGRGYTFFMYPVEDMFNLTGDKFCAAEGTRVQLIRYKIHDLPPEYKECEPIPYEAFEKAVKTVYSLEKRFLNNNDVEQAVEQDIDISLRQALRAYKGDAINSLIKNGDRFNLANKDLSGTYCNPAQKQSNEKTNEMETV